MTDAAMKESVIVCATDFSAGAVPALAWATDLAIKQGASLDLVHVVPELRATIEGLVDDSAYNETARHRAAQELARLAQAPITRGVVVRPEVLIGDAPLALDEHVKRRNARFLVLGASARSTMQRWLLGSVAERTVRRASVPVVIVPVTASDPIWPSDRPGRALVALEGNETSTLFEVLSELRRRTPCDVTVLHLYWPPEEYARLGLRGPRDVLQPDPDVIRDLEPRLRALSSSLTGSGKVTYRIQPAWGEPASNIALAADRGSNDDSFDVVVVGAQQRHGVARLLRPPVAAHLLRQALGVPIICVPTKSQPAVVAPLPPGGRISSVLAATDLSPQGNASVAHAYALLRGGGGAVELLYVQERGLPGAVYAYEQPAGLSEAERRSIAEQLRSLIPADAAASGISTQVSVIDGGRAAESIVQAAERLHVDAICVGSHGRSGVGRAVLGSVSDEVVRRAHRPVLVVR